MRTESKDLLHGTLDLLVLRALAGEPMHGFALSKWIDQHTHGDLGIVDSALYKALNVSRTRALCTPNGACPRTSAGRSTTH